MAKNKEKTDVQQLLIEKVIKRFSQEKIDEWKEKYAPRKINIIEVDGKMAVLRPITADDVATYSMAVADKEIGLNKATKFMLEELWIDGDNEIVDNEEYYISAMMQAQKLLEVKKSSFMQL